MKSYKIPKGGVRPRNAVLAMAPYSPPTGNRAEKLRLDFNENTVGCSPRVIEALTDVLTQIPGRQPGLSERTGPDREVAQKLDVDVAALPDIIEHQQRRFVPQAVAQAIAG